MAKRKHIEDQASEDAPPSDAAEPPASDIEYLMEPKGTRLNPGYSFADVARQRQYVNFLESKQGNRASEGFAAAEERRSDPSGEREFGQ